MRWVGAAEEELWSNWNEESPVHPKVLFGAISKFSRGFRRRSLKKGEERGTEADEEIGRLFQPKPAVRGEHKCSNAIRRRHDA
jgi:hypothetical protein